MNLHEKMVEIRKLVKALKKDAIGKTGFKDYPYISTDNILENIMDKMNELKVLLIPSLPECSMREFNYVNSSGKEKIDIITQGMMGFTWINAEEPTDREYMPWYFFGQQDEASKSLGSGLTYSQRYFLKMSFQIATDEDDLDGRDTSGKTGKPARQNSAETPSAGQPPQPEQPHSEQPQATDLEKRATDIYFTMTGTKEGQHGWPVPEYKGWLKDFKDAGKITTDYGKKWTQKDIEFMESQVNALRA